MSAWVRGSDYGVAQYVSTVANDAAVAELVSAGFSEAQAKQIVATAKKSPEQVAQEAKKSAASYVSSAANEEAKKRLLGAGFTEAEAERLVASGKDIGSVLKTLESVGSARLDTMVVEQLQKQGLSRGMAEALAATGGDPKKLLAIAKDPKKVAALVGDIDARLRKEGIDLGGRLKKGLGLSDADMKTAKTVYAAAGAAYDVFQGIDAVLKADEGQKYIASRWDERALTGDASFAELARALDDMGTQSDALRAQRTEAYKAGARKIASGIATGVSLIPAVGSCIGAAVILVNEGLAAFGVYDAKDDDNASKFEKDARAEAEKIWKRWQIVPPTFDSTYYTLATYRDVCGAINLWLDESDRERPWRDEFFEVLFNAYNQVLGVSTPLIDDLTVQEWLPLAYSDWSGGVAFIAGSHWNAAGRKYGGYSGISMFPRETWVGGEGNPGELDNNDHRCYVHNSKIATPEARMALDAVPGYSDYHGFGLAPLATHRLPRGVKVQTLICDRIAATLATVMAVAYGKPAEPLVQRAVEASRECVRVYEWAPENAARRLRDTFLATLEAARAVEDLAAPKYLAVPFERQAPVFTDESALELSPEAKASIERARERREATAASAQSGLDTVTQTLGGLGRGLPF